MDRRPDATKRGYDRRWQIVRAAKRQRDPLCEWCKEAGIVRLAELVDHYIPLRCGGTDAEENLVSMCARCHARKTRDDKAKYQEYRGAAEKH